MRIRWIEDNGKWQELLVNKASLSQVKIKEIKNGCEVYIHKPASIFVSEDGRHEINGAAKSSKYNGRLVYPVVVTNEQGESNG